MPCDRYRDWLGEREAGLLDERRARELGDHLETCAGCRAESERMGRLVGLLARIPEAVEVPVAPRPRWGRSARGAFLPAAAAALVAAAASLLVLPLFEERAALEGTFRDAPGGALVAEGTSSAVVLSGHRLRCRKGTRIRLQGAAEAFVEEGRLDVRGLREPASRLRIGTPLGHVEVLGTEFVVEVSPVKGANAALAGGGFIVGVLVSSGVVSYAEREHRLRLDAGQAVVAETGKAPRRVEAPELERRRHALLQQERDLGIRLAAAEAERARLKSDVEARISGRPQGPRAPLGPAERRARFRNLAKLFAKGLFGPLEHAIEAESVEGDSKYELTVELGEEEAVRMTEAFIAASELGVSMFDPANFLAHPEFLEELVLEYLGEKERPAHEALVANAVRNAFESVKGPWEFRAEERLAHGRALAEVLRSLEGGLPAERAEKLYGMGKFVLSSSPLLELGAKSDDIAKALGLEDSRKALLEPVVAEWLEAWGKSHQDPKAPPRDRFARQLQAVEADVKAVRRLAELFPDKKDKLKTR